MAIKVTILDDHQLMLQGLEILFEKLSEFELIEKFYSPAAFLRWINNSPQKPDICLIDVEMKEMSGAEVVKRIRRSNKTIKLVALTMHEEPFVMNRMIAAGANGYLQKNIDSDELSTSLKQILEGNFVSSNPVVQEDNLNDRVSSREREIIIQIARGKTTKEIAKLLFISPRTVDKHREKIRAKLKLKNVADLIHYANINGLI